MMSQEGVKLGIKWNIYIMFSKLHENMFQCIFSI